MIAKSRKASKRIAALLAATLVVTASPVDASAAAKPAWKTKKTSMTVGQKYTFKVKNVPSKGTVTFSSSKKAIATVKKSGTAGAKVTAKKKGKTVIKAVVKNKNKKTVKTLKLTLNVKNKPTATPKVTVTPTATPKVAPTDVPAVTPAPQDGVIVSALAEYRNSTTVDVSFNVELDGATTSNFYLTQNGTKLPAADCVLSSDKKTVTLTFNTLDFDTTYALTYTGLKSAGIDLPANTSSFKTPKKVDGYKLDLVFSKTRLVATGEYNTEITVNVIDGNTGAIATDVTGVAVGLDTNYGTLSKESVTITNGVAKTVLYSEFLSASSNATINATVNLGSSPAEYKNAFAEAYVSEPYAFDSIEGNASGEPVVAEVESNEADRVTLIFDQKIDVGYFVEQYEDGTWATELTKDGVKKHILKNDTNVEFTVKQDIDGDGKYDSTVDGIPEKKSVLGFLDVKDNGKALELILDEKTPLYDNCAVEVVYQNASYGINEDNSFIFTDGRTPVISSVEPKSLKELTAVFSEPIPSSQSENFKFSIDTTQSYKTSELKLEHGFFDPENLKDTRNEIKITLLTEKDANSEFEIGEQIYFKPGSKHSVQATDLRDYAALSDSKTDCENIVSESTALNFTAPTIDTVPAVSKVDVESPEQIRVTFNCPIRFKSAADAAEFFTTAFCVNDIEKGYINVFEKEAGEIKKSNDNEIKFANGMGKENRIVPNIVDPGKTTEKTNDNGQTVYENKFFKVTDVTGENGNRESQFVVETVQDWSVVYGYNVGTPLGQYQYNTDKFEFLFGQGTYINDDNGMTNAKEEKNLSDNTPLSTLEYSTPEVKSVDKVNGNAEAFVASLNVPVQFNITEEDVNGTRNDYITHNTQNRDNGIITATIKGKNDRDVEETITNVTVEGFAIDDKKTDTKLLIKAMHTNTTDLKVTKEQTLQELVDDEGWSTDFTIEFSNIYDDSGLRSVKTEAFKFSLKKTAVPFEITQVTAATSQLVATDEKKYDVVYVTFTKGVNAEDDSVANAVNWILDGVKVPGSFSVRNDIEGPGNQKVGYRRIMLLFPEGTFRVNSKHALNVNQELKSKDSTTLTGANEWVFKVHADKATALADNRNAFGY